MTIGLVGRKCGMTRVFTEAGDSIPVTVIEVEPNLITQIKTQDKDGYIAVQVTTGKKKVKRVTKAQAGHFANAKTEAGRGLWEFRANVEDFQSLLGANAAKSEDSEGDAGEGDGGSAVSLGLGSEITVNIFKEGQYIDVAGTSKGKGFAGVIKRYNFKMQDATHGNSLSHRAPGSIGQNQSPGKVFKGKKMAGHMGNVKVTVQTQEIVKIDTERNLLLVKGGIPGAPGGSVIIKPAVKSKK